VILLWPALLVVLAVLARSSAGTAGGRGWRWFLAWAVSGALFLFSMLTGFSIGLFLFPLVVVISVFVVRRAPWPAEALGFAGGLGVTLGALAWLNGWTPLVYAGGAVVSLAALGFGALELRRPRAVGR
jgi:hypothetical protein